MNTLSAQNKPLAAIYIRVSTEEQALHGFSLAGQEDALKNYGRNVQRKKRQKNFP